MRRLLCAAVMAWPALLGAQEVGPEFAVTATANGVDQPVTAAAGDGRFMVAWGERTASDVEIMARRFDAAGQPLAASFRVNAYTTGLQREPAVAANADGLFTVAWIGPQTSQYQSFSGVKVQSYAADGTPRGSEFLVSGSGAFDSVFMDRPAVAVAPSGAAVVAWSGLNFPSGMGSEVMARLLDASGAPVGGEILVNTTVPDMQMMPSVSFVAGGGFVVAWTGRDEDGTEEDVFLRRFDSAGVPLGGELPVNTHTAEIQGFPSVAAAGNGGFVVAWVSSNGADDSGAGIFARQFDAAGDPLGPEFRVAATPVRLVRHGCTVTADVGGGFAVAWSGGRGEVFVRRYGATGMALGPQVQLPDPPLQDDRVHAVLASDGAGGLVVTWAERDLAGGRIVDVRGQRYGASWPSTLSVDGSPVVSDGNGVLDTGETVRVAPSWLNLGGADAALLADASGFTGPGAPTNPAYVVLDGTADYGLVPAGASRSCEITGDCYLLGVTVPAPRPQRHMDATFREDFAGGHTRTWRLHVGGSFNDVGRTQPFYPFAETLLHHGVSGGCTATDFCPGAAVSRGQMAVFLLSAKLGSAYQPPRPPLGVFTDVAPSSPFAPWIDDLWNREIVTGCGASTFCPGDPVTRAQMAVMLLLALEGPRFGPPACVTSVFSDVPCTSPFAPWINELAARGITAGCAPGQYCPGAPVTRGPMAAFLSGTFGLEAY